MRERERERERDSHPLLAVEKVHVECHKSLDLERSDLAGGCLTHNVQYIYVHIVHTCIHVHVHML